jgi:hypothetical protein
MLVYSVRFQNRAHLFADDWSILNKYCNKLSHSWMPIKWNINKKMVEFLSFVIKCLHGNAKKIK